MKKILFFVAALSMCALAAEGSLEDRVDGLQAKIDRVMAKAGIHFSGEFRSQFLNSTVDGDEAVIGGDKTTESAEYTSVDFDITARPNTALSARAMFRLHQDWRNFFSDVQNPITTRWLSIDGSLLGGIIKYSAGDYKKRLTPLTLWSPDIELLYEPDIFAQGRELAMSEAFLGENNRVLQGANLGFKAELYPILHDVELDIITARLATRGSGESAPIAPGVGLAPNGEYWDALFDKYLIGANVATQIVNGAGLGISNINIFDNIDTYRGGLGEDVNGVKDRAKYNSVSNNVFAGRVNVDNRAFMSDDFIRVGIGAEAAFSSYKFHNFYDSIWVDANGDTLRNQWGVPWPTTSAGDGSIDGMAINANLSVNLNFSESNALNLLVNYIQNDTGFVNEAAQSPSFIQRSILNNENDLAGLGVLNPFDALYRSVFKYTPSQYFSESRPYAKNAYTNVIFTKDGIPVLPANIFQAALPGGLATADRSGPVVKLDGSFLDRAVTIGGKAALLNATGEMDLSWEYFDPEGTGTDQEKYAIPGITAEFQEFVGGASIDVAKFAPAIGQSLVISGSFGMYNAKNGSKLNESERVGASTSETASTLLSFALNYNFVKRFSFLVGYQQLASNVKTEIGFDDNQKSNVEVDYTFGNMAFGFGYKVADGAALTAKLTMLSGKMEPKGGEAVDYTAMQPEVYLTVKF